MMMGVGKKMRVREFLKFIEMTPKADLQGRIEEIKAFLVREEFEESRSVPQDLPLRETGFPRSRG